jgi:hypothetical protein
MGCASPQFEPAEDNSESNARMYGRFDFTPSLRDYLDAIRTLLEKSAIGATLNYSRSNRADT